MNDKLLKEIEKGWQEYHGRGEAPGMPPVYKRGWVDGMKYMIRQMEQKVEAAK